MLTISLIKKGMAKCERGYVWHRGVHFKGGGMTLKAYRDRTAPHRAALPHHRTYGSVYGGSADQAESDPGEKKTE